jgi:hypothetical protein
MFGKYLKECGFDSYFRKLTKKLKGKSVIVYGTGILFEAVYDNYDLSQIDIIGVSDMKYYSTQEGELDFGYKIIPVIKLLEYECDAILVGAKEYFDIIEYLKEDLFEERKIEIIPLVKVPLLKRIKDFFFD